MTFDFGKVKAQKKEFGLVDPIELFQKNKSKITDADINDLWLGQGDALRDWHEHRHENDVAIVLNTHTYNTLPLVSFTNDCATSNPISVLPAPANPSKDILVIELSELKALGDKQWERLQTRHVNYYTAPADRHSSALLKTGD